MQLISEIVQTEPRDRPADFGGVNGRRGHSEKSRTRSRMEAQWDLQQLSCLEPDVSSDDVTEAMEVAKDAGFDVLEAADSVLTKKLLLQDIAVAMSSEDAGRVQALCAMAGHAGLLSARLARWMLLQRRFTTAAV